jgi:hypothetical protein
MGAFLTTLVLLGLALVWLSAWQRRSRFAQGFALGIACAVPFGMLVRGLAALPTVPVWLPPLPFALIAIALFGFGLMAWTWADD